MDLDKKARALTGTTLGCGSGPYDYGPCKDVQTGSCACSDRISAALKAAYNEGLEDAIAKCEVAGCGRPGCTKCVGGALAYELRSKKLPT